ncbi:alpha/beta hydrolase fold [Serratia rubidaea]|uniref:alpha/beta fold hydrolase n=1 Tax=Serratia rubidaea TaxID=61652 RepID=UPI0007733255|nr:alpha/beta hydrolase [Serratia rubidaea]AML57124.1 alpha/beta hydrolase fold [Serratia rubidaea]
MNTLPERQQAVCGGQRLSWREAGQGRPVLLLHGISSGSASWLKQFADAQLLDGHRLIAWDAPGYGASDALASAEPLAADYAGALAALVSHLGLHQPLLVGHSLGALMGSAYAAACPDGLCGLALADPAQGYATADAQKRRQVFEQRRQMMHTLGPQGYGEQRAAALLRADADPQDIAWVRRGMQQLHPDGFLSAAWMLANDDINGYLARYRGPLQVWCGEQDAITPPAGAEAMAARQDAPLRLIAAAGHASYLDAPASFNRLVRDFTGAIQP